MPNFHQTIIVGHLGKDPEVRYMPNGDAACNFSIAVTESWSKDGEKKEQTTWYRVSAFKKLAEICGQYLKKGSPTMIVGKMQERKWTDKEGKEHTTWELRADTMQMLGGRSEAKQEAKPAAPGAFDDFESDIPFN